MVYYKLTDEKGQTYGGTQWGRGVTHVAEGGGRMFCSPDLLHLYSSPLLAVFLNPIHANFKSPRLWEAEAEIVARDRGLKLGAKRVTTIREIALPIVTSQQKACFGILCGKAVYTKPSWVTWATAWLSGEDRSKKAASAAADAAYTAAYAAADAAYAVYAAYAAAAAAYAVYAAADAAAAAAYAVYAAADAAAAAAAYAADAAAYAANTTDISFILLAEQAMKLGA